MRGQPPEARAEGLGQGRPGFALGIPPGSILGCPCPVLRLRSGSAFIYIQVGGRGPISASQLYIYALPFKDGAGAGAGGEAEHRWPLPRHGGNQRLYIQQINSSPLSYWWSNGEGGSPAPCSVQCLCFPRLHQEAQGCPGGVPRGWRPLEVQPRTGMALSPPASPHAAGRSRPPASSPSPAPAGKSSREKAGLSACLPPVSPHGPAPRTGKDVPTDGEHLSQPLAIPGTRLVARPSHPVPPMLLGPHSHAAIPCWLQAALLRAIWGISLEAEAGRDLLSLPPKATDFAVASAGTGEGPVPSCSHLGKAGVIFSKRCFQRDLLVCQQDRAFHGGCNH